MNNEFPSFFLSLSNSMNGCNRLQRQESDEVKDYPCDKESNITRLGQTPFGGLGL
jgi:hypothetical protein